ncbi:hypothetical protein [Gordonia sp. (in: high G+C Gram-positive bacteria)]|uniref:hypothetical protein n=1 Tax=Gordonia sp. (in: high G+C Gram-positive bacteria) TaxID=84139 RepID=UPI00260EFBD9|nr:hypothetical protein [Gordonia sp. (in: high G+C Gram-positive bacteria)]
MKLTRLRRAAVAAAACTALTAGAVAASGHAAADPAADGAAAQQAIGSIQSSPTDAAAVIDGIDAANQTLQALGITPFTPTIGACTDGTFPLAVGGAVAGPGTPGLPKTVTGLLPPDLNAVRSGEVLYGFVPAGVFDDSKSKSGMQVAWFNTSTMKGAINPMDSFSTVILDAVKARIAAAGLPVLGDTVLNQLKAGLDKTLPANGARGGIVDTDKGTVLSAIFGSVEKSGATCYFFPSLGIATVQ